ncbi:hypothetical protein [Streptomyces sp. NBC_01435]|uniref:hypothetical protein n=1 Tax=Streptomyces sp. NBC_01435 TaxID=2903865 RepID=UPI002E354C8D|nr:hypothetical protein [Streptomyces sp. NBC_01435]
MSARTLCPRCPKVVRIRKDGAYGVHTRGPHYCTASALTPAEVREGRTYLRKRTEDFLAKQAQGQTSPSKGDQVT